MGGSANRRRIGLWCAFVYLGLGLLARTLGALVVHEHDDHAAHLHIVARAEATMLDRVAHGAWHAHAHDHDDVVHEPVEEDEHEHGVLVVSLPDDPLQAPSIPLTADEIAKMSAAVLVQIASTPNLVASALSARPQPPDPPPPRGLRTFLDRTQNLRC